MNAICASRKGQVSARVDKDFDRQTLAHFVVPNFYYSECKFEQLARSEIFLSNLNEVYAQVHLIANNLKQWTETADGFAIGNVVAFHVRAWLAENTVLSIPDEVYSRGRNLKAKAIVSAELLIFRFTDRSEDVIFKCESNPMR